jgi:hypothetical protein
MLRDICLHNLQRFADLVNQAQVPIIGDLFIGRQNLLGEPFASADPDEIAMLARRDQMRMEYRLDEVPQSQALAYQLFTSCDLPSQRQRLWVWNPDFRQKARGIELGQDSFDTLRRCNRVH